MAFKLASMVVETSTTTSTGSYALGGVPAAPPQYRTFLAAVGNGATVYYRAEMGSQWEIAEGTLSGGTTLSRTRILTTHAGSTTPLSWGAGTKTISLILPGEVAAVLDQENEWAAHQRLNAYRMIWDADRDSYTFASADDVVDTYINGVYTVRVAQGVLEIGSADSGSSIGPSLYLNRNSSSPAASDFLGGIYWYGETSTSASVAYGRIITAIESPTNASYSGRISFAVAGSASLATQLNIITGAVYSPDSTHILAGKSSTSSSTVGAELRSTGVIVAVADGTTPFILNRLSNDGTLVSLQQAGSTEGSITVSGTTVTYNTFLGAHWSMPVTPWVTYPEVGTVLCMCDERCGWDEPVFEPRTRRVEEQIPVFEERVIDGRAIQIPTDKFKVEARDVVENVEVRREPRVDPKLPRCRVSDSRGAEDVYGVFGGVDEDGDMIVWALGTAPKVRVIGPVRRGRPLWASDVPGVAEEAPADAPWWACLGRASLTDLGTDERMVPLLVKAG